MVRKKDKHLNRIQKQLGKFIVRTTKKKASGKALAVLPEALDKYLELWQINS